MILVGGTVRLLAIGLCEMQIGFKQKRNVLGTQKVAFLGIYKPQTAMWTSCSLNTFCLHPEHVGLRPGWWGSSVSFQICAMYECRWNICSSVMGLFGTVECVGRGKLDC